MLTFIAGALVGAISGALVGVFVDSAGLRRNTRAEVFTSKLPAARLLMLRLDDVGPLRESLTTLFYSAAVCGRSDSQLVDGMLQRLIDLEFAEQEWAQVEDRTRADSVEYKEAQREWQRTRRDVQRSLVHSATEYHSWLEDRFVGRPSSYLPRKYWRQLWKRRQARDLKAPKRERS